MVISTWHAFIDFYLSHRKPKENSLVILVAIVLCPLNLVKQLEV